jgi:hypothetical protein
VPSGGVKLPILDNSGFEPLGPKQRHDVLELVEDYGGGGAAAVLPKSENSNFEPHFVLARCGIAAEVKEITDEVDDGSDGGWCAFVRDTVSCSGKRSRMSERGCCRWDSGPFRRPPRATRGQRGLPDWKARSQQKGASADDE